jgi:hypothetical protein
MMADSFTIDVPGTSWNGGGADMPTRLADWQWPAPPPDCDEVILDFSNIPFVEPWAIAMFVSHALDLKHSRGMAVRATLNTTNLTNTYIRQMGIDDVLATGLSTTEWDTSPNTTGIHIIKAYNDIVRFNTSLESMDILDKETKKSLRYCVLELCRNVVQHSSSATGGVAMAQLFPERAALQVTVCDSGRGVFDALRGVHPELKSHLEAVKAAVLPHFSGTAPTGYFASDNAGLGLFFTKEIAWRAGGSFYLTSGDHLLCEQESEERYPNRRYAKTMGWRGTSVTVDIPVNHIADFDGLFVLLNELARQARTSPGEAGLDFLQEIPDLEGTTIIRVEEFSEDVERAREIRETIILPKVANGGMVIIDFDDVGFATQSFVHALLYDVFRIDGSLARLSFAHCTRTTETAVKVVAAYAATYHQRV